MAVLIAIPLLPQRPDSAYAASARQMEFLNRGLVAVKVSNGVYLSWRLLGTEAASTSFNVYRNGTLITTTPITNSTNYVDTAGTASNTYTVAAVVNGAVQAQSTSATVWSNNYKDIPIQKPAGGTTPDGVSYTYSANDASVGDLDGDGDYEIVLKWDPSNSKDNSQSGYTGNVYLDAYELDGTRLWRIDLGKNIRAGAHYTQFLVYDLDGDGKAEVACKTADGTKDSAGTVIGSSTADYRNSSGYILSGPEYLTVFAGSTGKILQTVSYEPARGTVSSWGDSYGNRVDRFLAGVAYLDGVRPSIVMGRGYYTRTVIVAYDYRNGSLAKRWTFDTNASGNSSYAGQGNHQLSIADVDSDGKDEVIYGAMAVNDDGTKMYTTGLGHGDAMHVGDLDPDRPGLEVFDVHENTSAKYGAEIHDAKTGEIIWGQNTGVDTGRGLSGDIDPRYRGEEVWTTPVGVHSATGTLITTSYPSQNFAIWWDGDLLRELLDHSYDSSISAGVGKIDKWNYSTSKSSNLLTATGTYSNNTTKGTPSLQADLLGDWREEVIWRTTDSSALRLYTTTAVTTYKLPTLMHDSVYRLGVAWQNVAYNQPPHTSYFLGDGMATPAQPNIYTVGGTTPPVVTVPGTFTLTGTAGTAQAALTWTASSGAASYKVQRSTASSSGFADLSGSLTALTYTDTTAAGGTTYYYRVVATNSAGTATSNTVSVTPASPSTGGGTTTGLAVQYRPNDTDAANSSAAPQFIITNSGTSAVDMSTLKVRYYFTKDNTTAFNFFCDWAQIGSDNVQAQFVSMTSPTATADTYLELTFKSGAGSIAAGGNSGQIQTRFSKTDWSNFSESNDYSFSTASTSFVNNSKVTLYVNGTLAWGVEPS
ncbi:rhamnogalacturonan lyase family protein [Paenibacillus terricola]|nr:cellulose binding domain-containing protein [Paenibacillus terricola]